MKSKLTFVFNLPSNMTIAEGETFLRGMLQFNTQHNSDDLSVGLQSENTARANSNLSAAVPVRERAVHHHAGGRTTSTVVHHGATSSVNRFGSFGSSAQSVTSTHAMQGTLTFFHNLSDRDAEQQMMRFRNLLQSNAGVNPNTFQVVHDRPQMTEATVTHRT